MFNLGFSELIMLAAIALIFIGPKQLPEVARVIGRLLNEFKRATSELTTNVSKLKEGASKTVRETVQDKVEEATQEIRSKVMIDENFLSPSQESKGLKDDKDSK